ncbi:MAG: hypothetical protein IBJ11_12590, partial [Phycisphaerales bacterium]|nr:hypothetical protein [Phycisphaerales bacterium]
MPTYDYRCSACGHEFEEFQSMSAKPLRKCPNCGKQALERLIGTGAGVLFKGGGFYETDYRSDSYKKAAEADNPASSDPKPAEAAKPAAESKPATPDKPTHAKPTHAKPTHAKPTHAKPTHAKPATTKPQAKSAALAPRPHPARPIPTPAPTVALGRLP